MLNTINLLTIPLAIATGAGHLFGATAFFVAWPVTALVCLALAALEQMEQESEAA